MLLNLNCFHKELVVVRILTQSDVLLVHYAGIPLPLSNCLPCALTCLLIDMLWRGKH